MNRKTDLVPSPTLLYYSGTASPSNTPDNMWLTAKNHMPQFYAPPPPPPQSQDKTFTFSAEQLVKFVANVAIQVAQPQVCFGNPKQDVIDKKSSLCRRVYEAVKNHLGVDITGITTGQLCPPAPSAYKPRTSCQR